MRIILALLLAAWTTAATAAPVQYLLEADKSQVGFSYRLNGQLQKGTMPVAEARLMLDFADLAQSQVAVSLNAAKARAGFVFATDAMRGSQVLDTRNHPLIRFESSAIAGALTRGATVEGMLTLRGVTRPVRLDAQLFRQKGSAEGDLSHLTILLSGAVSRSAFGADGFPREVGDEIGIDVVARIRRTD